MTDKPCVLIVEARFYEDIADEIARGAIAELDKAGVAYERISVPGTFEIPAAIRFALRSQEAHALSRNFAGFIALGCVIRGATPHFEYVAAEASKGVAHVMLDCGIPIMFGILTTDTIEQAVERAGTKSGNKGADAAIGAIEMVNLLEQI